MNKPMSAVLALAALVSLAGCDKDPVPSQAASLRYQVDAASQRVWWLTRDGVVLHNAAKSEKVAVSLPGWVWVGEPYSCGPALAVGPEGEAVITSNVVPTVWRVNPDTLAVTVHPLVLDADTDKDVGFSGLVYSSEQGAFFGVSDLHGSLWKIDARLTSAQKIALSDPMPNACRVAIDSRAMAQALELCVRAPQKDWKVKLPADQRFGHVRGAACSDLPWRLSQLSLNDR